MDLKNAIRELESKLDSLTNRTQKVRNAIEALKELESPEPKPAVVVKSTKAGIKYSFDKPTVKNFVIDYIHKKGEETGIRELFAAYNKRIGRNLTHGSKPYRKAYQSFYATLAVKRNRKFLKSKVYQFKGAKKEVYFDIVPGGVPPTRNTSENAGAGTQIH